MLSPAAVEGQWALGSEPQGGASGAQKGRSAPARPRAWPAPRGLFHKALFTHEWGPGLFVCHPRGPLSNTLVSCFFARTHALTG